jgi:non-specific serine/threonine protein kinase
VRLFVERAAAVLPTFTLTQENAGLVAQVCRRLDGVPLAIELAAARVKVLSLAQIAARLDDCFRLLAGGDRTAMPRHQTLRAAIDWSYDLLAEAERVVFRRLGVFAGRWTLEAAEAVLSSELRVLSWETENSKLVTQNSKLDVLEVLANLVDKSLVVVDLPPGGTAWYRMLEPVWQYSRERLRQSGEATALRERHAAFYLELAETAEPELSGKQQEVWLDRLEAEHDNLRAALAWALGARDWGLGTGEPAIPTSPQSLAPSSLGIGLRLAGSLWWFWEARGHTSEGRAWLANALARAPAPAAARARALLGAGFLADSQGDYPAARALLEESLALSQTLGDQQGLAYALVFLGLVVLSLGDHARTSELLSAGLTAAQAIGDTRAIAKALHGLGMVAYYQGDAARAAAHYTESLALFQQLGDLLNIGLLLGNLGVVALARGDYQRARALFEKDLALCRQLRNRRGVAWDLYYLGTLALEEGDAAQARALYDESLALRRELGDRRGIAETLEGLAGVAAIEGRAERAARLFAAAAALWQAIGEQRRPANQPRYERTVSAVYAALRDDQIAAAGAAGRAMSLDQAVAEALG